MAGLTRLPNGSRPAYSHGVGWATRTRAHLAGLRRATDPVGSGLVLVDGPDPHPDHRPLLRRIAAEAVILQDDAEAVMHGIRARQNLGDLAPQGGPLVRRFFELRDRLPARCGEPADEHLRGRLDAILHHHAMALHTALDLLACEWRSPRLAAQVDTLDGLGEPARMLDEVYRELNRDP